MSPDEHPLTAPAVVLVRTRNPLNIGAAARAMVNFGWRDLRLVAPFDEAWAEARSAVGAAHVLASARVYASLAEALADRNYVLGSSAIGDRRPAQPVIDLPELAGWLAVQAQADSGSIAAALVFGQEKHGLTNEDLSHCHAILRIPTLPEQASMNLGQAVAVCLYEWSCRVPFEPPFEAPFEAPFQAYSEAQIPSQNLAQALLPQQPAPTSAAPPQRALAADTERLGEVLYRLLAVSGYLKPATVESARTEIRALLHRIQAGEQDTHRLTGMLAKIEHFLRQRA